MATTFAIRTASSSLLMLHFLFAFLLLILPFAVATTDAKHHTTPVMKPNPKDPPSCSYAVYPYWSLWDHPAVYDYEGGRYKLRSTTSFQLYMSPEWDDTNSTYYVRLSDNGATYAFTHIRRDFRPFVSPSDNDIQIYNVHTGRYLSWRNEGGERFLIESNDAGRAVFQFSVTEELPPQLPCPLILGACCLGYNFRLGLSESAYGLAPYIEDGVTYFKLQSAGDDNLFPFLLIDASGSSASSNSLYSRFMPIDH